MVRGLPGGTALRLIYNFGRFSLDLDFDATQLTSENFQKILKQLVWDLSKLGFSVKLGKSKIRRNIFTSQITFPGLFSQYGIHTLEELMVRVEVLNLPAERLKKEAKLLRNFDGKAIVVNVLRKDLLATEKIVAFFQRTRERDYYDVFFLIFNKFPIDLELLNQLLPSKYSFRSYEELIETVKEKFLRSDLDKISLKLEPFLIDPRHLEFIRNPETIRSAFKL